MTATYQSSHIWEFFMSKNLIFMRVILDNIDPATIKARACVTYLVNQGEYTISYEGNFPKVYKCIVGDPIDELSFASVTRNFGEYYKNNPPRIGDAKYYIKCCKLLSTESISQCPKCLDIVRSIPIRLDGECLLGRILGGKVDYEEMPPSGNINAIPNTKKFVIFCSINAGKKIKAICEKKKLKVSINKAVREGDADVKIITDFHRMFIDTSGFTHIIFINTKKMTIDKMIKRCLPISRSWNLYVHIL
jgi:hypothetical protein